MFSHVVMLYVVCIYTVSRNFAKLEALGQCRQGTSYQCRDISSAVWRIGSRSARKCSYLFIDSLPTFPEYLMQIRSEVLAQSC